jgi:putative Holliday junction resolvase
MLYTRLMDGAAESGGGEARRDASGLVPRIAAFDVGDRRIGVALTDALGITVQPLLTIYCKTAKADLKSIGRILRRHEIAEAVVGNPLHMSGEESPRARKAQELAAQIGAEFGIPVHLMDERLTSWEAHQILDAGKPRRGGVKDRQERRKVIDQVAAVLILEAFLEARAHEAARDRAQRK